MAGYTTANTPYSKVKKSKFIEHTGSYTTE